VSRSRALTPTVLAVLAAGALSVACHDVEEYGAEGSTGVTILDTSDLSVVGTIPGFPGGRSVCSLDMTHFLVSSNTGLVYAVSSENMAVEDVRQIGSPFSTGYCDMTLAPGGSVYLVGGFGLMLELNPTTYVVLDEFYAGPSPTSVCRSLTQNRIYVGDSQDRTIREISTSDNTVTRELELPGAPYALSTFLEGTGSILAASSAVQAAYVITTEGFFNYREIGMSGFCSGVAGLPDTSVYCVSQPEWGGESGYITLVRGDALPEETSTLEVTGHPACACSDPSGHDFFVASYLEDGTTRIYKIDGYTWDVAVTRDIPGYPWDMVVHAAGSHLLVLTLE